MMNVTRRQQMVALGLGVSLAGVIGAAATGVATAAPQSARHSASLLSPGRSASARKLIGTFTIKAGKAEGKKVTGSYFRMITPAGSYFGNSSSSVDGGTYTLLKPGTAKGLRTGGYQPQPSPAFASNGDSLANKIIQPTKFENINFSASTAKVDPQTGTKVPVPTIKLVGHKLKGDLAAFAASWNKQNFNQGSPKPDGKTPGRTTKVTGTYNARTHKYAIAWDSLIVGGPFNGFTGTWHLTGTFHAA